MGSLCEICKPDPPRPNTGPGVPVPLSGVIHRRECVLLPRLTPQQEVEYALFVQNLEYCRRKAAEAAANIVIG